MHYPRLKRFSKTFPSSAEFFTQHHYSWKTIVIAFLLITIQFFEILTESTLVEILKVMPQNFTPKSSAWMLRGQSSAQQVTSAFFAEINQVLQLSVTNFWCSQFCHLHFTNFCHISFCFKGTVFEDFSTCLVLKSVFSSTGFIELDTSAGSFQ